MNQRFIIFLAIVASTTAIVFGATYTKHNSRVARMHFVVSYDTSNNVTAVNASAVMVSRFVNAADSADQVEDPQWRSVGFDLLSETLNGETITAAGKTVSYPQLAALLRQAALDRANAAGVQ